MAQPTEQEKPFLYQERQEVPNDIDIIRPISVELFFAGTQEQTSLPDSIARNSILKEQAAQRRLLYGNLGRLFEQIEDVNIDIDSAVNRGLASSTQVEQVYQGLTEFLAADQQNARIILYLPFELLPNMTVQIQQSESYKIARQAFAHAYVDSWKRLLEEDDIRANFVEGDILEQELRSGPLIRVKKAAHLLPMVIGKGLVTMEEVLRIIEITDDAVLKESIQETLAVVADKGLIKKSDWDAMLFSPNRTLTNLALETSHTFTRGTRLDRQECDRLFELFDPSTCADMPPHEMYSLFVDRFKGVGALVERDMFREDDVARFSYMLLAGMQLWPMYGMLTEIGIRLAKHMPNSTLQEALGSYDDFKLYRSLSQVQEWVSLWNKKQDIASGEIMDVDLVWERIEQAKQYAESATNGFDTKYGRDKQWFAIMPQRLQADLQNSDARYSARIEKAPEGLKARFSWERQENRNRIITEYAHQVIYGIQQGILHESNLEALCAQEIDDVYKLVGIKALAGWVEEMAVQDLGKAKELSDNFQERLTQLWEQGSKEVRDAVATTWYHWASLGILDQDYLKKFGLVFPKLDALFPISLNRLMEQELQEFIPVIERMSSNEVLAKKVYPTLLFFGSRLKGYANENSDLDTPVFVRPEVMWEERQQVIPVLSRILADTKQGGDFFEFWIGGDDQKRTVRDVPLVNSMIADRNWAHVVFGGVWLGKKEQTEELYKGLALEYLNGDNSENDARAEWLRIIEREVLQYRLMHKGYARFYPRRRGIQTEHEDLIDGQSDFWDPGFRRIATRLFLSRVFLPDLKK